MLVTIGFFPGFARLRSAIPWEGHRPRRADRAPGRCRAGEGLAWR